MATVASSKEALEEQRRLPKKCRNTEQTNGHKNGQPKQEKSVPIRQYDDSTALKYSVIFLLVVLLSGGLYCYYFVTEDDITYIKSSLSSILGQSTEAEDRSKLQQEAWQAQQEAANMAAKQENTQAKTAKEPTKGYAKKSITCKADNKLRGQLDMADAAMEDKKYLEAQTMYEAILSRFPTSPRALWGRASVLDKLSEEKRLNSLLEESIAEYLKVVQAPDVPEELAVMAAKRGADRATFRGWSNKGAAMVKLCMERFPSRYTLSNDLGVQYLMSGNDEAARSAFQHVLDNEPDNAFALVHMGFIIKTHDDNPAAAIPYLRQGIDTEAPGTVDGRFYFHLGDAYFRTGQSEQSYEIYKKGAEKGLYPSFWQRSLYNVDGLKAQPWWTAKQTGNSKYLKTLEDNWQVIRDEGLANMDPSTGAFKPEDENLRETGDWKQFTLFQRGTKNEAACKKAPKTCELIEQFYDAATCKRGQVKFSVMQAGVHVWPHCGPTNCRIRAHLGLVVPEGPRIRVANETRTWKEGKFIIFDDSFEHEVWHDGTTTRLVLIVDMWHPDLTQRQKMSLSAI